MGKPEVDDLVDLGKFLQQQRNVKVAKEGLSKILLKRVGDSSEQRWLRSNVRCDDGQELGW